MAVLYLIIKFFHITVGTLALLSGFLAIFFRNKTKIHKPFGRVYFWCMTFIFFTAVYMSLVKGNVFLFCVAFFTYYSCLTAYRSLRLKKLHLNQIPSRFDWFIEVFFGTMHLAFVVFALMMFGRGNTPFAVISLIFGSFGLRGNYLTVLRLRKKLVYKNYWLLAHIGGMLGSYIGAITAFTVNNSEHIPLPQIVLWLGPTAFLVPLIVFEIKKHQSKTTKLNQVN